MANIQIGTQEFSVVDKRRSAVAVMSSATPLATPANYDSIAAMRTRLAAINGAYYTAAMLDVMTMNDMQFAIRTNDDLAGV